MKGHPTWLPMYLTLAMTYYIFPKWIDTNQWKIWYKNIFIYKIESIIQQLWYTAKKYCRNCSYTSCLINHSIFITNPKKYIANSVCSMVTGNLRTREKNHESSYRAGQVWDFQTSGFPDPTQRGQERRGFSREFFSRPRDPKMPL